MNTPYPLAIAQHLETLQISKPELSPQEQQELKDINIKSQTLREISEIIPSIKIPTSKEIIISMRDKLVNQQNFTINEVTNLLYSAITAAHEVSTPQPSRVRIGSNGLYE